MFLIAVLLFSYHLFILLLSFLFIYVYGCFAFLFLSFALTLRPLLASLSSSALFVFYAVSLVCRFIFEYLYSSFSFLFPVFVSLIPYPAESCPNFQDVFLSFDLICVVCLSLSYIFSLFSFFVFTFSSCLFSDSHAVRFSFDSPCLWFTVFLLYYSFFFFFSSSFLPHYASCFSCAMLLFLFDSLCLLFLFFLSCFSSQIFTLGFHFISHSFLLPVESVSPRCPFLVGFNLSVVCLFLSYVLTLILFILLISFQPAVLHPFIFLSLILHVFHSSTRVSVSPRENMTNCVCLESMKERKKTKQT